jgi:hypothetical protein
MSPSSKKEPGFARKPLHRQVADYLRQHIFEEYNPGDQLEAESRQCKRLGISLVTLREALGTLAGEGIIERRQGQGTFVCDPAKYRHVAVLCELDIGSPDMPYFFRRAAMQLCNCLTELGISNRLYTGTCKVDEDKVNGRPKGITSQEFLDALQKHHLSAVAAVGVNRIYELSTCDIPVVGGSKEFDYQVIIEMEKYTSLVFDFMKKHGRSKLGIVDLATTSLTKVFQRDYAAAGIELRDEWLGVGEGRVFSWTGAQGVTDIMDNCTEKPDTLMVVQDALYTSAAMELLKRQVKIPEEMMVISHANHGSNMYYPFETTLIKNNPDQWAEAAAGLLNQLVKREPLDTNKVSLNLEFVPDGRVGQGYYTM